MHLNANYLNLISPSLRPWKSEWLKFSTSHSKPISIQKRANIWQILQGATNIVQVKHQKTKKKRNHPLRKTDHVLLILFQPCFIDFHILDSFMLFSKCPNSGWFKEKRRAAIEINPLWLIEKEFSSTWRRKWLGNITTKKVFAFFY